MEKKGINRRGFVGGALAASATMLSYKSVQGANDRIVLALIGAGSWGTNLILTVADINKNPDQVKAAIEDLSFDSVVNWIAFTPDQIERDIELFTGKNMRIPSYQFVANGFSDLFKIK